MTQPLSASLLQTLETRLRERQAQLLAELGEAQAATLEVTQGGAREVTDQKDLAESTEQATVRDAEATRDHQELVQVRAALTRLAQGSYGICPDCEEAIAEARLQAFPAALRCLACQNVFESART